MNHIDEKTLELYVLKADEVKGQRAQIAKHLKRCAGCEGLYREISAYYREVEWLQEASETSSTALSLRDRIVRVSPFLDRLPVMTGARTIPARAVEYVFRHAVISSLSFVAIVAGALLLLYPKEAAEDLNPAYARAKDEFLVAYNKNGEELWRKHIGEGFDFANPSTPLFISAEPHRVIRTIDVDRDGKNEVISIPGWVGFYEEERPGFENSVLCYNADGSERWRYEFHRDITIGKVRYSDDYRFYMMAVADFDGNGTVEVIAAVYPKTWFSNAVVRLNANDGSFISEYWLNGYLARMAHKDIDNDGVEEIFLSGHNSRLWRACLAVFDPRRIEGCAPAPEGIAPEGVGPGTEKYYILFPATDLEKFWIDLSETQMKLTKDNVLEVWVLERFKGAYGYVKYCFDLSMKCVAVTGTASFEAYHRQLEDEGKVIKKVDAKYYEQLRQGVRYWDGEKFVAEPTMNKRYFEGFKESQVQK